MLDVLSVVIAKLLSVFRTIDPDGFTAVEFCTAYTSSPAAPVAS